MQPITSNTRPNRLIRETSPYLLQHAYNPVQWYAWGSEAFDAARRENKPIFLSVGYSTCYWCHVMERQSFENESVAAEMNRRFINIKVDREERPDVDQLYMTAVQVLTHQGGWPMSVFLTPDLRPFYGGTYFPPTDQYGRPGFLTVMQGIEDAWNNRKTDVDKSANQLIAILSQIAEPEPPQQPVRIDDDFVQSLIERSTGDYEPRFGGFGSAPKFPRETLLELLLIYLDGIELGRSNAVQEADRESGIREKLHHALLAMAHGGIRDHLGGGFHRYSTDARWLVPHFEIMLYDNAMLGWCYVEAFRQSRDERYAAVARGIFDFTLLEMTSPDGAFYTALDAEVDAQEGLSYLWTKEEIEALLGGDDAKIFKRVYGVDAGPNFADPHHGNGVAERSILFLELSNTRAASGDSTSPLLDPNLARMRKTLYEARRQRKQPLLDTKIITSWNALMVRAMARGGHVLGEQRYVDAATRAADFLLTRHRKPDGRLLRTSGGGTTREGGPTTEPGAPQPSIPGFLDDYAYLAQALLALDEAGAGKRWREEAMGVSRTMLEHFGDVTAPSPSDDLSGGSSSVESSPAGSAGPTGDAHGFFFTERDAKDLIIRQKIGSDSPLPSGNAVAAMVMLALDQPESTRATIAVFANSLQRQGEGMSAMVQAALLHVREKGAFTIGISSESDSPARPESPHQTATDVVDITTEWETPKRLIVHLNIRPGFHINANEPQSGDLPLIPTRVTPIAPAAGVESMEYPTGDLQNFAFAEKPIRVYSGQVSIAVRFHSAIIGQHVRLSISYQACDETSCLPETRKQIDVT